MIWEVGIQPELKPDIIFDCDSKASTRSERARMGGTGHGLVFWDSCDRIRQIYGKPQAQDRSAHGAEFVYQFDRVVKARSLAFELTCDSDFNGVKTIKLTASNKPWSLLPGLLSSREADDFMKSKWPGTFLVCASAGCFRMVGPKPSTQEIQLMSSDSDTKIAKAVSDAETAKRRATMALEAAHEALRLSLNTPRIGAMLKEIEKELSGD